MSDEYNALLADVPAVDLPAGPLAGLRIGVKDNICLRGTSTTCGSRLLEGWVPPYDATVVSRLRAAGGNITAKTNLDEFGMGSTTEYSAYGPTLNPADLGRVPGGSSGGSAAAVAGGLCDVALGSDTGGSVRQPASFCGVYGIKPTYGLVSRYGLIAYASSLDQIGVLGRSVEDLALTLGAIAGHDPLDSTSLPSTTPDFSAGISRDPSGLKIGVIRELMDDGLDGEIAGALRTYIGRLEAIGITCSDVSIPSIGQAIPAYYLIASAEASSNLARYDGVRYGNRVDGATTAEMMTRTRTELLGEEVRRRIMLGTFALSAGYHDQYYGKALRFRTLLRNELDAVYGEFDLLLGPTSPVLPFEFGEKLDDPLQMYLVDTCTVPANLAGHPAVSIPAAVSSKGLPIGLQLFGPPLSEPVMLSVAAALEDG